MKEITLKARAKINLTLDVVGKREDGYHLIETIMQNLKLYDRIYMKPIFKKDIVIKSNLPWLPTDQRNLAYKAVELIKSKYDIDDGVFIQIDKKIPVSAGLAGGSADCAAVLVGMNQLFDLRISRKEMELIGSQLGSDIPYCLRRGTVMAKDIGTELHNLDQCPHCYVVLAKLPVSVSTVGVYKALDWTSIKTHPNNYKMINAMKNNDIKKMGSLLGNVLEDVTISMHPKIGNIKECLLNNGATGALMSGSGPTVFGLFEDYETAKKASLTVKEQLGIREVYVTEIFQNYQKYNYHYASNSNSSTSNKYTKHNKPNSNNHNKKYTKK